MSGRSRIQQVAKCTAALGENIGINFAVPFNATLLQFSANIPGVPAADVLEVQKASFLDPAYDVVIRRFTPSTDGRYFICNEPFHFLRYDRLVVTFANTADLDCGFEAIFTEGG